MWQFLGSNFSQTIGCFASKGEVKGIVLFYLCNIFCNLCFMIFCISEYKISD